MSTCSFIRPARIAGAVRLTDVQPTATRWLWPGRMPLGRVTLLVSDPGLGKSLLALDVAARVTSGAPWPDQQVENQESSVEGQPPVSGSRPVFGSSGPDSTLDSRRPASVLLLTAEDDLADTVRPRLEALGADCSRIVALPAVPGDTSNGDVPRAFALNRDFNRLGDLLDTLPDCRLIVIDPISAYLGDTSENANADVRNLLVALTMFARERDLAVLAISHLRKKEGAAIHRTMGSLAFVAAARAAWLLVKDPDDPARRFFVPIKNNLGHGTTGLAFTIEASPSGQVPILRWETEPVSIAAETVLAAARPPGRPDEERQHASRWLQEFLSQGPRDTSNVHNAADAHGISLRTLRRAFRDLDGEAVKQPFSFGHWMWKLPGKDGQNPGGEYWPPFAYLDEYVDQLGKSYQRSLSQEKASSPPS